MNAKQQLRETVEAISTYWWDARLMDFRNDVLAAIDASPFGDLDAAWAAAEAALPDGWLLAEVTRRQREDFYGTSTLDTVWTATALEPREATPIHGPEWGDGATGDGATPTDALRALTEQLRIPAGTGRPCW